MSRHAVALPTASLLLVLLLLQFVGVVLSAGPDGFVALFQSGCPTGWSEMSGLEGRLLLLVNNSYQAGEQFGFALADGEDRQHQHIVAGTFNFPSKHVAGTSRRCAPQDRAAHFPVHFLESTGCIHV